MVSVTLTTFTDFATATGTARLTKVRNAKRFYDAGYAPERDFYKPLRDRIVDNFSEGWDPRRLKASLEDIDDPKKSSNYEACRVGLTKWAGRKKLEPAPVRTGKWQNNGLSVAVNPELALAIGDEPHLIKLYLKSDELSQQKANLVLHLMATCLGRRTTVAVLDVRRSKLFTPTRDIAGIDALLASEALAFVSLWGAV